ncbi:serine protease [Vibrio alginolyticus]|uniref:S1 family peptidase n=1 Tax=Vibrio alginolyticus TaxID=663 RepID=UPI00215E9F43|nr:serine protease [Vibrio alginolyticus]MCS0110188.1 serine protease [Vibrio alginolyticus]
MNKQLVEAVSCKIDGGGEKGSGFFVTSDKIITCRHVIAPHINASKKKIKITLSNSTEEHEAKLVDDCQETDLAILSCKGRYTSEDFLELSCSEIIDNEKIYIYGYPYTQTGQLVGEPLHGEVSRTISNSTETIHDVDLNIKDFNGHKLYKGFSGSPVVNGRGLITSVLRFASHNHLSSVSITKAKPFLLKNGITVKDHELTSFNKYRKDAFVGFSYFKDHCDDCSKEISDTIKPIQILETRKDDIFYPRKQMSFDDIKKFLRENKNVDENLWIGWIQFLTYMKFLEVDYSDLQDLRVKIETKKFTIPFIKRSLKTVCYDLNIKLLYTEESDYLSLARNYMRNNKAKMRNEGNSCHIFNSHIPHFGKIYIDPSNIIDDCANPIGSTPSVEECKIGVVSLEQLSQIVINSTSPQDAVINIKKKLENVII